MVAVGTVATGTGVGVGIVLAVFLAGFRHGFDLDHVAAITDITSGAPSRRSGFLLATLYASGHMLVVFGLGLVAVFTGSAISTSFDLVGGRLIGITLIALGCYVLYSLIRYRRDFRVRSRWMLLVAGARRALMWLRPTRHVVIEHEHPHSEGHHVHSHSPQGSPPRATAHATIAAETKIHSHAHKHVVPMPSDPFTEYGPATSFVIGMVHGVGAETPTQILLFTTAAGIAGARGGIAVVGVFVLALLLGNTVLAAVASAGFSTGKKMPLLYMGLAAASAIVSMWVGASYLFDRPEMLLSLLRS